MVATVFLTALGAWGCGGDATAGTEGAARVEVARDAPPDGLLVLGDERYEFRVTSCHLDGEFDTADEDFTLAGSGATGGGRFFVHVGRSATGTGVDHEVVLRSATMSDGLFRVARRQLVGERWLGSGSTEVPDEPLVTIEGRTVRAEGTFGAPLDPAGTPLPGRLTARCP